MHFPDGLVNPILLAFLWIISITIMVIGYFRMGNIFKKEDSEKIIPYIGVLAAVIFAFQFVNYPIPGGTSGHLVGGTLIAVILGPWASVVLLFLVLLIQSFFGDGGITALGVNAFNMGIICGIVGFYITVLIVRMIKRTNIDKKLNVTIATGVGSYISIVLASFIAGIEIALSGIIPFQIAIPAMVYWHLLIGIGEAVISALIVYYIYRTKPDLISTEEILGVD
jgi:cobalt/nickel transport system permease protein